MMGHFALPFFALLPYGTKQTPVRLFPIAAWLLFVHYADVHWLCTPPRGQFFSVFDVGSL